MIQFVNLIKDKSVLLFQLLFAFLLPIKPLILLVGFMIALDTISGLWKARKLKQPITSHKLSAVVSKMVLYQVALITTYMLDVYIFGEFFSMIISIPNFMTKFIAIFFVFIEVTSMNENIEEVTGLSLWDKFKDMTKRIKEIKKDINEMKNPTD